MAINWILYDYTLIVKIITVIVLLLLLKIYFGSYKKIKMGYTLGLIIFAVIMLLRAIPSLMYMFAIFAGPIDPSFPPFTNNMAFESTLLLIALCVLYKITND